MKKLNARGFSHDIVLVAFVAIFAVAGVGFLVASHADSPGSTQSGSARCSIYVPRTVVIGQSVTPTILINNPTSALLDTSVHLDTMWTDSEFKTHFSNSDKLVKVPANSSFKFNGVTVKAQVAKVNIVFSAKDNNPSFYCRGSSTVTN